MRSYVLYVIVITLSCQCNSIKKLDDDDDDDDASIKWVKGPPSNSLLCCCIHISQAVPEA